MRSPIAALLLGAALSCDARGRRADGALATQPDAGTSTPAPTTPSAAPPPTDEVPSSPTAPETEACAPLSPPSAPASMTARVAYSDAGHLFFAIDPGGTAYGLTLGNGSDHLYASTDGARTWTLRHTSTMGGFRVMTALSDGTLLADLETAQGHQLVRSSDVGQSWTAVLSLGQYRMLTSHNIGELDGTIYFLEYQAFTTSNVPIRLWVSTDRGRTWTVRATYTDHRHGHGLRTDPAHHAIWLFFGDPTGGTWLTTDGGASARLIRDGLSGGVMVDAVVTGSGVFTAEDSLYEPLEPHAVTMGLDGSYLALDRVPGPAFSVHALSGGGYLIGTARGPSGDVYAAGDCSAHVIGSPDGNQLVDLLQVPRLDPTATVRADVYWELPTGEAVLQLENAEGFGPGGVGYELLDVSRP